MSDVKLTYDSDIGEYDIAVVNGDLERDDGLETAVVISLFTDRRAADEEIRPGAPGNRSDRRGWWADETLPDGDKIGSLLWLLEREKITPAVLTRAKQYAEDALAWLISDVVAESVVVVVTRTGTYSMVFDVQITQPKNVIHKYKMAWNAMGA